VNEYRVEVRIAPRAGLLDPEGKAIQSALRSLEFDEVEEVRVGRLLRVRLLADSPQSAREAAEAMCRQLLANPVTEDYEIEMEASD
jgi:phosphoribosylformylglycinamidine synthase PurS subunit